MILDGASFSANTAVPGTQARALTAFVQFFEKKMGVSVVRDRRTIPFGREDLSGPLQLAEALVRGGIIRSLSPIHRPCDEPPCKVWQTVGADEKRREAGGASWRSDQDALMAALAESLERALWWTADDHFRKPMRRSVSELERGHYRFIAPERFTSFSLEQRATQPGLALTRETPFLWTEGVSLVSGRGTYVPAQTISGLQPPGSTYRNPWNEPLVRSRHTIGLATWPTQVGAQLAGALECIEREAYMIMWLNQLAMPRLNLVSLCRKNPGLSKCVEVCERYRFKVHVIAMPTDAPTHAICSILEDTSGRAPRYAIGLKAHRDLVYAVEKSLLEALRARAGGRRLSAQGPWDQRKRKQDIGHYERLHYWAMRENARKLEFLVQGGVIEPTPKHWEKDSEGEHRARIIAWCKNNGFECVAIPFTHSKKNPTDLHVEMIVIPELQPTHLFEGDFALGGTRWQTVPRELGLTPRAKMFTDEPHPFV